MFCEFKSFNENVNKIARQVFYIKSTEKQRLSVKTIKGMNERKISKKKF